MNATSFGFLGLLMSATYVPPLVQLSSFQEFKLLGPTCDTYNDPDEAKADPCKRIPNVIEATTPDQLMHRIEQTQYGYKLVFEGFLQKQDLSTLLEDMRQTIRSRGRKFPVLLDMRHSRAFPADAQEIFKEAIRFFTEAKAVNDIQHPNIVDIFDFFETDHPRSRGAESYLQLTQEVLTHEQETVGEGPERPDFHSAVAAG